jgi:hypothetical protein
MPDPGQGWHLVPPYTLLKDGDEMWIPEFTDWYVLSPKHIVEQTWSGKGTYVRRRDMKWIPWEQFAMQQPTLPILAPPCPECRFWRPVQKFDERGRADGVICCHAAEQHKDFSCYGEKV